MILMASNTDSLREMVAVLSAVASGDSMITAIGESSPMGGSPATNWPLMM
jgi:hypothetical protein